MRNGTELFLQVSFLPIDDVDFIFFLSTVLRIESSKRLFQHGKFINILLHEIQKLMKKIRWSE